MLLNSISSMALHMSSRVSMDRTQSLLERASVEVSSGRHYDVGLALGISVSRAIDVRQSIGELDSLMSSNGTAQTRLEATQSNLKSIADLANDFFSTLTASRQSTSARSLLVDDAKSRLETLTSLLSTTINGVALFGGINTSATPLVDYLAEPTSAARAAVQSSFSAEFGFAPDDPQAQTISPAQMDAYLAGAFATNFQDPQWQTNFSSASALPIRDRISLNEVVETPVSANSPGIRNLVATLVAVIDSGVDHLSADSFEQLSATLADKVVTAALELAQCQSAVGATQERLANASTRMEVQHTLLEKNIVSLEGVDATEASIRLNALSSQLQVSYAVTGRLQSLSILNYL